METLEDILGAFEQALELERELGTRTVECDRALLAPLRPVQSTEFKVQSSKSEVQSSKSEVQSSKPEVQSTEKASRTSNLKPQTPNPDFAFIVSQTPQGAAADMLAKMVGAMGYAMNQVAVVPAEAAVASKPRAKVYVVLGGSDAFRTFAPGQRAALGLWTTVADVPTIVTYSPARILSYFGNDAAGLTKAKRQIWSDLKSALARIGRKPPRG